MTETQSDAVIQMSNLSIKEKYDALIRQGADLDIRVRIGNAGAVTEESELSSSSPPLYVNTVNFLQATKFYQRAIDLQPKRKEAYEAMQGLLLYALKESALGLDDLVKQKDLDELVKKAKANGVPVDALGYIGENRLYAPSLPQFISRSEEQDQPNN
jgi:hypothetical protein